MWQNKYRHARYIGIAIASTIGSYVGINYLGRRSRARADDSSNNVENEVIRIIDV